MEQQSHNTGNNRPKQPTPRRARLRLPFENKKEDPIDWIYEKRFGLCIVLMLSFTLAVVFVWAKVGSDSSKNSEEEREYVYIDMSEMDLLEEEPKPQEEVESNQAEDWELVRNVTSNENAEEGEYLRNDKFADDPALKRMQEAVAKDAAANKATYNSGVAEAQAILDNAKEKEDDSANNSRDVNIGDPNVAVKAEFNNPTRYSTRLIKPLYRCEGGGEVVVKAILNQSGVIISAKVHSGGDECMRQAAIESALGSRFNIDKSAPAKQEGTITYELSPQYRGK